MLVVDRMAYIVYFQGRDVIKKINSMPVNIAYVSKKNNYLVFYGDNNKVSNYEKQLKKMRGFKKIEPSLLYNEEIKFVVK